MQRVGVHIVTSVEAKVTLTLLCAPHSFHVLSNTGVILVSSQCKHHFCYNQNNIIKGRQTC
jgi:hypothetical protein